MTIRDFPEEILIDIFGFLKVGPANPSFLKSCCLVCRPWLKIAQPLLYEKIWVHRVHNLAQLHECVTNSKGLGRYVRHLIFVGPYQEGEGDFYQLTQDRMIAHCLEQTAELEGLAFGPNSSDYVTNVVASRFRFLRKLKRLAITNGLQGNVFDPQHLLNLPKTVEELDLEGPSTRLMNFLPKLNIKLHSPADTTVPSSLVETNTREQPTHMTGLRLLAINRIRCKCDPTLWTSLAHSLSPTLTSFTMDEISPIEESMLINFLAATPLLQHLQLITIKASPVLFDGLHPLASLRSLTIGFDMHAPSEAWEGFCRSLGNFLSHSPRFDNFAILSLFVEKGTIDRLLHALITSTTRNSSISSLRLLRLSLMEPPSIDIFEYLCKSAPLLQHLEIAIPLEQSTHPRAFKAIASLKLLNHAQIQKQRFDAELNYNIHDKTYYLNRSIGGEAVDLSLMCSEIS